jgi:hypothetical protein
MAIKTNTTKSIKISSTVLGEKCEKTQKELKALMTKAGCSAETKIEKITVPKMPGMKDDVLYVGLNGVDFYFKRGDTVQIPAPVAEIARNTGNL